MRRFDTIRKELQSASGAVRVYAASLYAAAATALLYAAVTSDGPAVWWLILGLAGAAGVAERQSVTLTPHTEMSVSFLPVLFAAVALGALEAALVSVLATLADFRAPYLRCIVYIPGRALTAAAAGVTVATLEPSNGSTLSGVLMASLAASAALLLADGAFNVATGLVRGVRDVKTFVAAIGPLSLLSLPFYVPLVALLTYGYVHYSVWVVAALLISAVAMQRLVHLYREERIAREDLALANARLVRANLSFATALIATLDARDRYTAGHSAAVAVYARDIARELGLSSEAVETAYVAGLVHDIGKIGLPASVLEKNGPLTLEERRLMQTHSGIGERILRNVPDYHTVAAIVRYHHERVDGNGYPDGLTIQDIPLLSRVIAVADAYNAMTSDRPYRQALSSVVACQRLRDAAGVQFDESVVAGFARVLAREDTPYLYASGPAFDLARLQAEEPRRPLLAVAQAAA